MAVAKARDDRTAPKGPEQRGGRRGDTFLFREEWRREPAGDESFAEPLRDQERGEAVLRSDLPHRARLWSPSQTEKGYDDGEPHSAIPSKWLRRVAASARATVKFCTLVADHRPGSACNNRRVIKLPVTGRLEQKASACRPSSLGSDAR